MLGAISVSSAQDVSPHLELVSAFGFILFGLLVYAVTRRFPVFGIAILVISVPYPCALYVGHTTITTGKVALISIVVSMLRSSCFIKYRQLLYHPVLLAAYGLVVADVLSLHRAHDHLTVMHETGKQIEYTALLLCTAMLASEEAVAVIDQCLCASVTLVLGSVCTLAALEGVSGHSPSGVWINDIVIPRIAGPLEGPNQLAGYLELTLPILILSPLTIGLNIATRRIVVLIATMSLILTQTRSAIGLMLLAMFSWIMVYRARARVLFPASAAGLAFGIAILGLWYANGFRDLRGERFSRSEIAEARMPLSRFRVRFVGENAPANIDAIQIGLAGSPQKRYLIGTVVTTSNVASLSVQHATSFANVTRTAFGTFQFRQILPPILEKPTVLLNFLAIRTDAQRTRCIVVVDFLNRGKLRLHRYDGLAAIRVESMARILDPSDLQAPGGVGTRTELWRAARYLFRTSPLTGVGAGNFETSLDGAGLSGIRTTANSLILQTAAEQGLVGVVAFTFFVGIALVYSLKTWKCDWLVRALICGSVLFLLHQVVDDLMFFPKVASMWWIALGIMLSRAPAASLRPSE